MIEPSSIDELRRFATPSILNGLKQLGLRPDEMAIVDRTAIHCISPQLGVRAGFAATAKIATRRNGIPPSRDHLREYSVGIAESIVAQPGPRFLAVENVGDWQGPVCIWGEVAANIHVALNCVAGVTNGPVRDLPEMEAAGFQTFAGGPATGGGYVDLVERGGTVCLGGVTINPGDLLHGDQHGLIKIPVHFAAELPDAIEAVARFERRLLDACHSPDFSLAKLAQAWT